MASESIQRRITAPLTSTSRAYYAILVATAVVILLTIEAIIHILWVGIGATDLGTWGTMQGVTWGLFIGTFEWFAGMALGAVAISGYIRYRSLDRYAIIARIGEIWGFIAGLSAAWLIVIDLGRPERVPFILSIWPQTIGHSPLAWDVTFVTTLLVFTMTMTAITLRRDFARLQIDLPRHVRLIKRLVTIGYREEESPKLNSMIRWLGLGLMVFVVTAGMVPGWLFGVVGAQAGYYGGIQGISFVAGGLASGVAIIAVLAAGMRFAYGWEDILPVEMFASFGRAMALFAFVYLVVIFNEILPMVFPMAPVGEGQIGDAMLFGSLAPYFWLSIILLSVATFVLMVQTYRGAIGYRDTVIGAAHILLALFIKKQLTVIEPLMYPHPELPYSVGTYSPMPIEWVITLGAVAIAGFLFLVAIKVVPMAHESGFTTGWTERMEGTR